MRTVAELKRLMRARVDEAETDYGRTLIELVIRRLKDHGYLNDSQYAASFTSLRRDNQKFGRMRVITDLKTKGVHGDLITKAVDAAYEAAEEAVGEAERSEVRGTHLPAVDPRRFPHQDDHGDFEEVGCG
jgi:regulatory protein